MTPVAIAARAATSCEGVWTNYLTRYGWDEFVPVPAANLADRAG